MILKRFPLATVALIGVILAGFGLSLMTLRDVAVISGQNYPMPILAQFGITISVAWLLPLALDGWVMVAMGAWMRASDPRARVFAQRQTYGAAAVSIVAQSTYHGVTALGLDAAVIHAGFSMVIGVVPPLVVASGIHLYMLTHHGDPAAATADADAGVDAMEAEIEAAMARMEMELARDRVADVATLTSWVPDPAVRDVVVADAATVTDTVRPGRGDAVRAWLAHWDRLPDIPESEPGTVKRIMADLTLSRRTVERARQDALASRVARQL